MMEVYFSPSWCALFVLGTQAAGTVPESLLRDGVRTQDSFQTFPWEVARVPPGKSQLRGWA